MKTVLCFATAMLSLVVANAQDDHHPTPLIDATTANLPAQRIGASDLLAISVYGSPELTRTVRVGGDGMIKLPMLKQPIPAAGKMPSEVERLCTQALQAEQLIVDPMVTVTVVEYQSRPISVMGAVRKPLTFQSTGPLTLLEALSRAEGLSADAGPEILVSDLAGGKPGRALIRRVRVKDLLAGSDPELNLRLNGGEEVRVPEAGKVYVLGNVKKPGAFTLGTENAVTVLRAVALAEGVMPYAGKRAVIYRREAAGSVNELSVDLKRIMDQKAADAALFANDVLYVPDAKGRRMGWAAIERVLMFGSGATTAVIYGAAVH